MLEYIEKTGEIYDLLALCCSFILKKYKEQAIEFNLFEEDKYDEVYDAIEDYCNACEDRSETFIESEDYDVRHIV